MADFKLLKVLKMMKEQVKDCSSNIFSTDRPKSLPDSKSDFIVVKLPVMFYNKLVGTDDGVFSSYVRYEIYVKDVRGLESTKKLTEITQSVIDTFNYSKDGITISRPRVVLKGSDGHGFHSTWIQASILIS